jgi:hypothetical protein
MCARNGMQHCSGVLCAAGLSIPSCCWSSCTPCFGLDLNDCYEDVLFTCTSGVTVSSSFLFDPCGAVYCSVQADTCCLQQMFCMRHACSCTLQCSCSQSLTDKPLKAAGTLVAVIIFERVDQLRKLWVPFEQVESPANHFKSLTEQHACPLSTSVCIT